MTDEGPIVTWRARNSDRSLTFCAGGVILEG